MRARDSKQQHEPASSLVKPPRVSVILPVYNCRDHLREAVESILLQSLSDIELLVLNDGSTDDSIDQIKDISDPRMRVFSRENRGLIATLNEGVRLSRSHYIARMDADDIAYPTRLERQLAYLEQHPKCAICCTAVDRIDVEGKLLQREKLRRDTPIFPEDLVFGCPICHPTVMFNVGVIGRTRLFYDPEYKNAEDFELWCRLLRQYRGVKLAQPLLGYRIHEGSITSQFSGSQRSKGIQALLSQVFFKPNSQSLKQRLDIVYRTNLTSYGVIDFLSSNLYLLVYAMVHPELSFFRQSLSSIRMIRVRLLSIFKKQRVRA
ncbi:glycosyltransferase [Alteromonas aestuariivivens]|uniref:Glycosyltransferase n=1 Tax=Alteromonas aestuariivivens TaxID=1938339 RepID=A0A3D8MCZ7_9ALTE|nr:glycosyltransferase [Alteromonas aestuariivivens]RDV28165.1 glycosyltransferase [Alteromonas aestuariivivens]